MCYVLEDQILMNILLNICNGVKDSKGYMKIWLMYAMYIDELGFYLVSTFIWCIVLEDLEVEDAIKFVPLKKVRICL
jgi:hypothetical protein